MKRYIKKAYTSASYPLMNLSHNSVQNAAQIVAIPTSLNPGVLLKFIFLEPSILVSIFMSNTPKKITISATNKLPVRTSPKKRIDKMTAIPENDANTGFSTATCPLPNPLYTNKYTTACNAPKKNKSPHAVEECGSFTTWCCTKILYRTIAKKPNVPNKCAQRRLRVSPISSIVFLANKSARPQPSMPPSPAIIATNNSCDIVSLW